MVFVLQILLNLVSNKNKNTMEENAALEKPELQLNESAKGFLKEAAKWAYFLSILGYIGIGFIVLAAIFAGTIFATIGNMMPGRMGIFGSAFGILMTVIYLLIAVLYFFPVYYLNKFATNAKTALQENDTESLSTSFEYLKSHYKFIGIMSVIVLSLYGVIIVFAIFGALVR
jgi:hypothetical protein